MTTSRFIGTTGCRPRVLPMCPERLRLSSGLPSPVEVAHAGLAIRQPTSHGTSRRIGTWDIAANRHHCEQSKLCHIQLSQNDWLKFRSRVSIQQNCQEARQELCRNFCTVDRLSCGKLSTGQIETTNVGHKEMRSCWHSVKYFHLILLLLCTWGLNIHGYYR